uniref:Uncharacterized protein n=1 Tax=Mycena chlorophos TaxID=658473 RepID=A0ABQ0KVM0_MYCCL|nr:predicted protein [Mycena chlorophos]
MYGVGMIQTWLYFRWWDDAVAVVLWVPACQGSASDAALLASSRPSKLSISAPQASTALSFVSETFKPTFCAPAPRQREQISLVSSEILIQHAWYLSAFTVQLYFGTRIRYLTQSGPNGVFSFRWGFHFIVTMAFTQMAAGTVQTGWTPPRPSFAIFRPPHICASSSNGIRTGCRGRDDQRSESRNADLADFRGDDDPLSRVSRYFLVLPDAGAKQQAMLSTLNMRGQLTKLFFGPDGVETQNLYDVRLSPSGHPVAISVSDVQFVHPPPTMADSTATDTTSSTGKIEIASIGYPSSDTLSYAVGRAV